MKESLLKKIHMFVWKLWLKYYKNRKLDKELSDKEWVDGYKSWQANQ
jgi:hypothetical protein